MAGKFCVVGNFKRPHKDSEGETQDCKSYSEALEVKEVWEKSKKYKKVFIVRND